MNFFQKYFLFSFIVFSVFFPEVYSPGTSADSPPKFDGYWWQTLPPEFQLGFILGYQEGLKMALGELIARNRSFPGSSRNLSPKSLEDQFRLRPQFTCGEIEKELPPARARKATPAKLSITPENPFLFNFWPSSGTDRSTRTTGQR